MMDPYPEPRAPWTEGLSPERRDARSRRRIDCAEAERPDRRTGPERARGRGSPAREEWTRERRPD